MMEDAMALLQTGKRLASAAFRRESVCWSDDSFALSDAPISSSAAANSPPPLGTVQSADAETAVQLLSHVKFLLRRRAAAVAALDAGLHSEAIRHLSKLVEGRRAAPQAFAAECYMHRAAAFRSAGRIAESIADCNRTLALDPSSIPALETRAALFESIRCLPDCLHDLEHLRLLYNSIIRDRRHRRRREIPGKLCALAVKIQDLKSRLAGGRGGGGDVDYHALIGLRRGCSRSELERAHRLLLLRHKPDKSAAFIERCEISDDRDLDSIRDRAKMSALLLYRLIQKAHAFLAAAIADDEAAAAELRRRQIERENDSKAEAEVAALIVEAAAAASPPAASSGGKSNAFQGVFCRDLAAVGNLLSQVGFNRPIPVKYEALSC